MPHGAALNRFVVTRAAVGALAVLALAAGRLERPLPLWCPEPRPGRCKIRLLDGEQGWNRRYNRVRRRRVHKGYKIGWA